MASMANVRSHFEFTTYGDAAFAIGGWQGSSDIQLVHRWTSKPGWVTMADYPIGIHGHCAVPDPGYDKIYVLGGNSYPTLQETRTWVYQVSANTWSSFPDLVWGTVYNACGIIRRRSTGNRIILLVGNEETRTQYFDLTAYESSGKGAWTSFATPQYSSHWSTIVTLNPYESFEVKLILTLNLPLGWHSGSGQRVSSDLIDFFYYKVILGRLPFINIFY